MAKRLGLSLSGAKYRIEKGIPDDKPVEHGLSVEKWRVKQTKVDLALEYGLKYQTVCSRLRRGIPLDAPVMGKHEKTAKARAVKANPVEVEICIKPTKPVNPFAKMAR